MAGLKSQSVGKEWEQDIIRAYYNKGSQPFKIPTELVGTCFDIIVIKNGNVMCIEAKHITGDKLYFKSSGLQKKSDEINHFIKHCNTNVYIFVKSDKTGTWFNSWVNLYPIFRDRGYITKQDCVPFEIREEQNNERSIKTIC